MTSAAALLLAYAVRWRPLLPRTAESARAYCGLLDRIDAGADRAEVEKFFDEHLHGDSPFPPPAWDFDCRGAPRKPLWKPTFDEAMTCALPDAKRRDCPGEGSECAPLTCSAGARDLAAAAAKNNPSANAVVADAFKDAPASPAATPENEQLAALLRRRASVPAPKAAPQKAQPGVLDGLVGSVKQLVADSRCELNGCPDVARRRMRGMLDELSPLLPGFAPDRAAELAELERRVASADAASLGKLYDSILTLRNHVHQAVWAYVTQKRRLQSKAVGVDAFLRTFSVGGAMPAGLRERFDALIKRIPAERVSSWEPGGEPSPQGLDETVADVRKRLAEGGGLINDPAGLARAGQELDDLEKQALDAVRGLLKREGAGDDAKSRLAALRKFEGPWEDLADGVAFRGLSVSPDGRRLELKCQSRENCERRLSQLPMEAEILLGTRFPVIYVPKDQSGATVLAGEDYGTRAGADEAKKRLDELTTKAAAADALAQEKRRAADAADGDADAARRAADQARAAVQASSQAAAQQGAGFDQAWKKQQELAGLYHGAQDTEAKAREQEAMDKFWAELLANHSADGNITFAKGKSLLSEQGEKQLVLLGQTLAQRAKETFARTGQRLKVTIHGHTSRTGSQRLNDRLAEARAQAALARLKQYVGDAPVDFVARGHGYDDPLPGVDPRDERQQRVEFEITDGLGGPGASEVAAAEQWKRSSDAEAQAAQRLQDALASWKASVQTSADASKTLQAARERERAALAALPAADASSAKAQAALAAARAAVTRAAGDSEKARAEVDAQAKVLAAAETRARGSLIVASSGQASPLAADPKTTAKRVVAALTTNTAAEGGLTGSGASAVRELLMGRSGGRTLAQTIGELEQRSRSDPGWFDYVDGFSHMMTAQVQRGGDPPGLSLRAGAVVPADVAPAKAQPKPEPIPVQIVTEADLQRLSVHPAPAAAPAADADAAASPAPAAAPQPAERAAAPRAAPDPRLAAALKLADSVAERSRLDAAALEKASRDTGAADAAVAQARERAAREQALAARRAALSRDVAAALAAGGTGNVVKEALFGLGSAALTAEGEARLDRLVQRVCVEKASDFAGHTLLIEGFASREGEGRFDNQALSQHRALSVQRYMQSRCGAEVAYSAVGRGVTTERGSDALNRFVRITVR